MTDSVTHLIFASDQANHNFARILGDLRRSRHAIHHRLHSICRDAAFVASVAARYPGLALVANERCGSWYIIPRELGGPSSLVNSGDPGDPSAPSPSLPPYRHSAYFKSTDGHAGQWRVSTRRLNLHLLSLGSLVLVDSTRRGKRMPDALSKTVPLWCCAVNHIVFGQLDVAADALALYTPPGVVSASEHSQMCARVPDEVAALRKIGVLGSGHDDTSADWRRRLGGRPLRPVWVTPDMPLPDIDDLTASFTVVVCCTASRAPPVDAEADDPSMATYIQGAADDTENWAHGLTPAVFWGHVDELLATAEADLPAKIASLVAGKSVSLASPSPSPSASPSASASAATDITPFLSVGSSLPSVSSLDPNICHIIIARQTTPPDSWALSPSHLQVGLGKQDKTAGRNLRHALPQICAFVSAYLARPNTDSQSARHVRVLCETGRDVSVGIALALLCACFDAQGQPATAAGSTSPSRLLPTVNKDTIRLRLGRIMTAMPLANPSRATLQSVNSFLMG